MAEEKEKATLSLPSELKRKARAKAVLEGTNLSAVVAELLQKWLDDEKG